MESSPLKNNNNAGFLPTCSIDSHSCLYLENGTASRVDPPVIDAFDRQSFSTSYRGPPGPELVDRGTLSFVALKSSDVLRVNNRGTRNWPRICRDSPNSPLHSAVECSAVHEFLFGLCGLLKLNRSSRTANRHRALTPICRATAL